MMEENPLAGKIVIVIEDDKSIRERLARILKNNGATVHTFQSHGDACNFPKADLIITDNHTEDKNGESYQGLEWLIRKHKHTSQDVNRDTPVIMVSSSDIMLLANKVGAKKFFRKPLSREDEGKLIGWAERLTGPQQPDLPPM